MIDLREKIADQQVENGKPLRGSFFVSFTAYLDSSFSSESLEGVVWFWSLGSGAACDPFEEDGEMNWFMPNLTLILNDEGAGSWNEFCVDEA